MGAAGFFAAGFFLSSGCGLKLVLGGAAFFASSRAADSAFCAYVKTANQHIEQPGQRGSGLGCNLSNQNGCSNLVCQISGQGLNIRQQCALVCTVQLYGRLLTPARQKHAAKDAAGSALRSLLAAAAVAAEAAHLPLAQHKFQVSLAAGGKVDEMPLLCLNCTPTTRQ